jgi:hypothetical protein
MTNAAGRGWRLEGVQPPCIFVILLRCEPCEAIMCCAIPPHFLSCVSRHPPPHPAPTPCPRPHPFASLKGKLCPLLSPWWPPGTSGVRLTFHSLRTSCIRCVRFRRCESAVRNQERQCDKNGRRKPILFLSHPPCLGLAQCRIAFEPTVPAPINRG